MIFVRFEEPNTPDWNSWKQRAQAAVDQMLRDYESGKDVTVNEKLYKEMKNILFSASFGKCVYCETKIDNVDQPGDVEHYRPKGEVTDELNQVVTVRRKGRQKDQPHPGYFWLAYDWKNLFLACRKCNSPNKDKETGKTYGKGTRFPVKARFWACGPQEISNERPLFIHPFFQDPADHFEFIPTTGEVVGKTDEGKACIELLNLNREGLVRLRIEVYRNVAARINNAEGAAKHNSLTELNDDLAYLNEYERGAQPYAIAGQKALRDTASKLEPVYAFLSKYFRS